MFDHCKPAAVHTGVLFLSFHYFLIDILSQCLALSSCPCLSPFLWSAFVCIVFIFPLFLLLLSSAFFLFSVRFLLWQFLWCTVFDTRSSWFGHSFFSSKNSFFSIFFFFSWPAFMLFLLLPFSGLVFHCLSVCFDRQSLIYSPSPLTAFLVFSHLLFLFPFCFVFIFLFPVNFMIYI